MDLWNIILFTKYYNCFKGNFLNIPSEFFHLLLGFGSNEVLSVHWQFSSALDLF